MPDHGVSVAIPVLNGGSRLERVLAAVRGQQLDRPLELVVADSGSSDGSRELAARAGARVIDIPPGEFSHGGTRNELMRSAGGAHVAFLTQDSLPADERWLARLLEGFELAEDVGLVFGPYRAREGASASVRRELDALFASFSPDGQPRVDRGGSAPVGLGLGRVAFFSDANGCVARNAWERVPYRDLAYAEDQQLAADMLAAGFAKAYHPAAAVEHSHDYKPLTLLRRSFDEWRALGGVHGAPAPASPLRIGLTVQREVRDDLELLRREGAAGLDLARAGAAALAHHCARGVGAALGSRSRRLPAGLRRRLSLEGRP